MSGAAGSTLDAQSVQRLGAARGFDWTLEEAAAISEFLLSTQENLRAAAERLDAGASEPASVFRAGPAG